MTKKFSNKNLRNANKAKKDEFYTQLSDIEKELKYYKKEFKNKIVYCNADDPFESNFFKYFASNFNALGLKKLIATSYAGSPIAGGQLPLFDVEGLKAVQKKEPFKIEINEVKDLNSDGAVNMVDVEWLLKHDKNVATPFKGDGDFRSEESIGILKEADIVVTNPPFSLFREYVAQLMKYDKKFLIIGNQNAITYKETFKLIKENKLWLGVSMNGSNRWFEIPDYYKKYHKIENGKKYAFVAGVVWFTNLDHNKRHEELILAKKYYGYEDGYPKYDDYDAINIDRTNNIPLDYEGCMGVPITFLHKYNPNQFEIIGQGQGDLYRELTPHGLSKKFVKDYYKFGGTGSIKEDHPVLGYYSENGKATIPYMRIIIKNKKVTK